MTTIKAYSVFDKTAGTFATPFFAPNDDVAIRNFRYSLKRLDDIFVEDLELYYVGFFNNDTGVFLNDDVFVIDTGVDVLYQREIEKKNSEVKQ